MTSRAISQRGLNASQTYPDAIHSTSESNQWMWLTSTKWWVVEAPTLMQES